MGKAFTEREKEEIRERIVMEAYALFMTRPFRSVKIEEIANAAGIGKGTMYLFFLSKEHVFIHVMMVFEEKIQKKIYDALNSVESSKEKLYKAIQIGLDETKDNEIYKALMDSDLMGRIMWIVSPDEVEKMAQVDLDFMDLLIGSLPIKIERELAVDLLRSVFYLRLFESQLLSSPERFQEVCLRCIIDQIV